MGIGGNFWDLLKPYARNEGFDFLRNKKVAVDLSFWIVQHETALKNNARNPHLRLTFFRTINLFSKLGAYPVFVVDGIPSPLKARARIDRFFRSSGIDLSALPKADEGISVERNGAFTKCVRECVELLELLGLPVLKAKSEAEALCAQLNVEGHVDACITADSDAFLFGAKCVLKYIQPNSREPFECYHISDIEAGLGLKRKHLVAISLLVGNDHDLNGVPGIGLDTALRFVRMYTEDEVLNRLHEVGKGNIPLFQGGIKSLGSKRAHLKLACQYCDARKNKEQKKHENWQIKVCKKIAMEQNFPNNEIIEMYLSDNHGNFIDESSRRTKSPHCSFCGHPGSKRAHLKLACQYCDVSYNGGCMQKLVGFKCECFTCDMARKNKEQKKHENWQIKVCKKIAMEQNFPNNEIIEMYLSDNHGNFIENDGPCLSWENPKIEPLVDFLSFHQRWEPSYVRQRMLPMLSTIFLREMASSTTERLLYGQYEFNSIQRVKVRFGHQLYVVSWKKAAPAMNSVIHTIPTEESDLQQGGLMEVSESIDLLDEPDVPQIHVDDGCWFLLTDENMELVQAAFPEKVSSFLQEKEMKESKSRRKKSSLGSDTTHKSASPKSRGTQLSITEFYRSTKVLIQPKQEEDLAKNSDNHAEGISNGRKKKLSPNLPKSVRRRLLFD
ncbi:hypothetical protein HHK36_028844 [Tetracentron sinense]|uniref:Flap endonuclease GEN-like 1 n=1 Tax=Tetracentron sinense TaxID=13715 RepID=A0A834YE25_TETSI|nr:hypothetical protein HHK36_028844 [Tetracentron sinense]